MAFITTKSRPCSLARSSASRGDMTPSISPALPMTRISWNCFDCLNVSFKFSFLSLVIEPTERNEEFASSQTRWKHVMLLLHQFRGNSIVDWVRTALTFPEGSDFYRVVIILVYLPIQDST